MKLKLIAFLFISLCAIGTPIQRHVQAQRSAEDYVQEITQLLRDADQADLSDLEADARRQRARQMAVQYASGLKASNPTGEDRLWLGYLYYLANDTEKAVATYREALGDKSLIEENKQQARLYLIQRLSESGHADEAEAVLASIPETSFNADETLAQAHDTLAIAYTKQGQMDKAVRHEEQALEAARKSGLIPRIWLTGRSLAQLYVALGRKADATKLLDELKAYFDRQVRLAGGSPSEAIQTAFGQIETAQAQIEMVDKPAPEITLVKWIKETATTLAALRGQVVALEFWAAWCPDCRRLVPEVRNWHARYAKDGLRILTVTRYYGFNGRDIGNSPQAEEESFLLKFKQWRNLPYGTAIDDGQRSFDTYHVRSIPTVAIIDRAGRVRLVFTWDDNPALAEHMIKKLLAEPAPSGTGN
ncbi:MAG: redoxin domain-containing protein [Acidobacteria bacterium]|nr:redoxin domain-containing protein [Acidobacteriota bacterium]